MKTALLCIGDELLKGATINTNLAFLGEKLLENGILPECSVEVPDQSDAIRNALDFAYTQSDTVLTSGGLGPTADDITKNIVANYFNAPLEKQESLEIQLDAWWSKFHSGPPPFHWNRQAWIPAGSQILPNKVGSAPGIKLEKNGKTIILLPGPPAEQRPMFMEYVLPFLKHRQTEPLFTSLTHIVGVGESIVEERTQPLLRDGISVAYCASPEHVKLFFTSKNKSVLEAATREAREIFAGEFLTPGCSTLPEEILHLLNTKHLTLATAESCTGGLISARITEVPGSSNSFLGGVASYSNELKKCFLGVKQETLERFGAVSSECAGEMVKGVCERTGADAGISVTGIAGPDGGTQEKPVGRVYIGVKVRGKIEIQECTFRGGREQVRNHSVARALNMLRKMLMEYGK